VLLSVPAKNVFGLSGGYDEFIMSTLAVSFLNFRCFLLLRGWFFSSQDNILLAIVVKIPHVPSGTTSIKHFE
jgi:hypothetical protein